MNAMTKRTPDILDLTAIAVLYVIVVATFRVAFSVITTDREIFLFVVFAVVGLLAIGVIAPVAYTVLLRHRSLASLGVGSHNIRSSLALGVLLGGVQFAFTLRGYDLPRAEDWVPLLLMSLVVGLFESIFFRGFVQNRLEVSFGILPAIVGAAGLYSLYHVGYEMGAEEMGFLFLLGIAYAVIFRLTSNILALWPLITPVGAFYNNLEAGDIDLPWLSMIGFGEVLVAMLMVLYVGYRIDQRQQRPPGQHVRTDVDAGNLGELAPRELAFGRSE